MGTHLTRGVYRWFVVDTQGKKLGGPFVLKRVAEALTDYYGGYALKLPLRNTSTPTKVVMSRGRLVPIKSLPEYGTWRAMLRRCYAPGDAAYKYYGAKGIRVVRRWHDFCAFFADVGPKPTLKHELDRFPNVRGNYAPGNVQWVTHDENMQHTIRSVARG